MWGSMGEEAGGQAGTGDIWTKQGRRLLGTLRQVFLRVGAARRSKVTG